MLILTVIYADCRSYVHSADCHYAKRRHAECPGVKLCVAAIQVRNKISFFSSQDDAAILAFMGGGGGGLYYKTFLPPYRSKLEFLPLSATFAEAQCYKTFCGRNLQCS